MGEQFTEKTFHTGTVAINYAEGPDSGAPVVLLHGGSANWHDFEDLGGALSQRWHVYLPDLRGHGKSGRVPWGYSVRDYAADIGAFLQHVSGPAALFGHSLGGVVAVMTAAHYPVEVRALLVSDAPLDAATWLAAMSTPGHREMQQQMRALSGGRYTLEEIIAGLKQVRGYAPGSGGEYQRLGDIYPPDAPVFAYLARRLIQHDPDMLGMLLEDYDTAAAGYQMDTLLPAIQCPVLLMQADPNSGGAMTDEEAARAMALLRNPHHIQFHGRSHLYFWEDGDRTAREIDRFLEEWTNAQRT